jgi:hypothetical protein
LLLSVAPPVKITDWGSAPTAFATARRARSTTARAACPSRWMLDAFPGVPSRASTIASLTVGKSGAVAFQSKYNRRFICLS